MRQIQQLQMMYNITGEALPLKINTKKNESYSRDE